MDPPRELTEEDGLFARVLSSRSEMGASKEANVKRTSLVDL